MDQGCSLVIWTPGTSVCPCVKPDALSRKAFRNSPRCYQLESLIMVCTEEIWARYRHTCDNYFLAVFLYVLHLVAQSCPTLCNPRDCSPPGSSVHGILQTRILEWVAMPSSRGSSQPRNRTQVSRLAGDSLPSEPPRSWYPIGDNLYIIGPEFINLWRDMCHISMCCVIVNLQVFFQPRWK